MDKIHETVELLALELLAARAERDKYKIDSAAWEEAHDEVVKERDALKAELGKEVNANYSWMTAYKELEAEHGGLEDAYADLTRKLGEAMKEAAS